MASENETAADIVAEMREALVALRDAARNFCHQILNSKYNDIMDEYKCRERGFPALLDLRYAISKANVALSAPPRNCDLYKDADSAYISFCGYDFAAKDISDSAFIDWLFAPSAERKGDGDGGTPTCGKGGAE